MKRIFPLILVAMISVVFFDINLSFSSQEPQVIESYLKLPLFFIENQGQIDKKIKFYQHYGSYRVFFADDGVYLVFQREKGDFFEKDIVKLMPLGTDEKVQILPEQPQNVKVNYFIGKNPDKWRTNISAYKAVLYKEAYPGIDIRFYSKNQQLEYDIVLKPKADIREVKFQLDGVEEIEITKEGDLLIRTKSGKRMLQKKPIVYQIIEGKKINLEGRYVIIDKVSKIYSFNLASYDTSYPLVIDPVLVFSTFIGGEAREEGLGIAVDKDGYVYVTGATISNDFPADRWIGEALNSNDFNVFVVKLDPSGSKLIYSTVIGGSICETCASPGSDQGYDIAVDRQGNAYIVGKTYSTDFPTTSGAFDQSFNGGYHGDAFVAKLDSNGVLAYSTYLGGNLGERYGFGIAVDSEGNVYVTGGTAQDYDETSQITYYSFPHTKKYYTQRNDCVNCIGVPSVFVVKINPNEPDLIYSVIIGGVGYDFGTSIAVDLSGNAYVTGETWSHDFPITQGAFQANFGGADSDAFLIKLDSSGNLIYSTFLGGSNNDSGQEITLDPMGNIYITGNTRSLDFPLSSDAFDQTPGGKSGCGSYWLDGFVTKLDPTGTQLIYSTYVGGELSCDESLGIAVDSFGNAYVTGMTLSDDFPVTSRLPEDTDSSGDHVFVTQLSKTGDLLFSTRLGGSDCPPYYATYRCEKGYDIAIDSLGNVCVTGLALNVDFPTTPLAFQTEPGSDNFINNSDIFVFKLGLGPASINNPPYANAGLNLAILSEEQNSTVITGFASDPDGDDLTYRWIEGENELLGWTPVGPNGEACLDLSMIAAFSFGEHTLTLEVSDGQAVASDEMILTVSNSAPHPAPIGGGIYEVNTPVVLVGQVSDFDGDVVTYEWLEGDEVLFSGQVKPPYGGGPVTLPEHSISNLDLGTHTLTLRVSDGVNAPVSADITVVIQDTQAPTLAPVPNKTILWPPNHKMLDIVIEANAYDNSGAPVVLEATVSSNEPQEGLGDGDMSPDWTEPEIDQIDGIITLQLRAERSGSGDGRVYTVTITGTDESGNASTAAVEIIVPHDKRK